MIQYSDGMVSKWPVNKSDLEYIEQVCGGITAVWKIGYKKVPAYRKGEGGIVGNFRSGITPYPPVTPDIHFEA